MQNTGLTIFSRYRYSR